MNTKFLLDENIPIKIKNIFEKLGIKSMSIQEMGWSGYKDKEIISELKDKDYIIVTRDKDFTFLWNKFKLKVIYIAIQPAIIDYMQPRLEYLLNNWVFNLNQPFLLIIQNKTIRLWK